MSSAPIVQEYGALFELARQNRVIVYYEGYFSQNIVAAMAEVVKLQLEISGAKGPTRRKLFSSFVEMAQNIVHYSCDALTSVKQDDRELRYGSVCVSEREGQYLLLCANPIEIDHADGLREKLRQLRGMTLDEIKQAYKESLRAEAPDGSKGAGMGLLTMARDASEPLDFELQPLPGKDNTAVFYLKAAI